MEEIKSSLNYTEKKFKEDIDMLIKSELEAIEDYKLVLDNIENTEYETHLKPILDEILADEKDHLNKLNEYKSNYLVKDSAEESDEKDDEKSNEKQSEDKSNTQKVKDDDSLLSEEEWDKLEELIYTNDIPMHSEVLTEYNRLVGYDNMSDAYIVKSFIEESTDYKADVKHILNKGWVVDITK